MDSGQLTVEKVTQLLLQRAFPASVESALITVRECPMLTRNELFMLMNRFVFCHSQSTTTTNSSWMKTLNNIQELHALDILREFLENQSDGNISARIFDILFTDILADSRHPLFVLYYDLILKFLSLVISFESKQTLTLIARWILTLSTNDNSLWRKIIEYLIREHISLAISNSMENFCTISPLFTLCFINQTCLLLDQEPILIDMKTIQILIELLTYGLTNSTTLLLGTLQQEFSAKSNPLHFNFVPSMIRLNVLFPLRSIESSSSLRLHLDHFHTSILSFLFSIVVSNPYRQENEEFFSTNYFEQLAIQIQDLIGREGPDRTSVDECVQRYLQILAICKTSPSPLSSMRIRDLGKNIPLFARHKLFGVLQRKEQQQESKKK